MARAASRGGRGDAWGRLRTKRPWRQRMGLERRREPLTVCCSMGPLEGAGGPSPEVQLWRSIRPNHPCSFAAALSGLAVRPVEALSILCKHEWGGVLFPFSSAVLLIVQSRTKRVCSPNRQAACCDK